jgi:hypothetical protein
MTLMDVIMGLDSASSFQPSRNAESLARVRICDPANETLYPQGMGLPFKTQVQSLSGPNQR